MVPVAIQNRFLVEEWTIWFIALLFLALRFYTRLSTLGWKKLRLDDALILWAMAAYTAEVVAAYFIMITFKAVSNGHMTDAERAAIVPGSEEWQDRVNGSITHIVEWFAYINAMWSLKACWAVYFSQLTSLKQCQTAIRIGYGLIAVTYLTAMLVVPCKCLPMKKQWQINPDPGDNCQPGFSALQMEIIVHLNAVTDLYLLAIPVPMIFWTYRGIPISKRISLLVLFSGGFLIIAFAILRCVVSLDDVRQATPADVWALREIFTAIMITNFPIILPLAQHWYHVARGEAKLRTFTGEPISEGLELGTQYPCKRNSRSRAFKQPLGKSGSWDSDEQIMVPKNSLQTRACSSLRGSLKAPSRKNSAADVGSWKRDFLDPVVVSKMDLVPKKEKSRMKTTVLGGADLSPECQSKWRPKCNERSPSPRLEVQEGKIMVVEEFTYTAAGRSSHHS